MNHPFINSGTINLSLSCVVGSAFTSEYPGITLQCSFTRVTLSLFYPNRLLYLDELSRANYSNNFCDYRGHLIAMFRYYFNPAITTRLLSNTNKLCFRGVSWLKSHDAIIRNIFDICKYFANYFI